MAAGSGLATGGDQHISIQLLLVACRHARPQSIQLPHSESSINLLTSQLMLVPHEDGAGDSLQFRLT
jgi:hypothetical protein